MSSSPIDIETSEAIGEGRNELTAWLSGPPGQRLLAAETRAIGRFLPNLFGYYLIQVGHLANVDLLASSRVMHRLIVAENPPTGDITGYASARGRATQLPVAGDSTDVVVLPHVLEYEANPHEALREAERILVPEGHVIIAGFNPYGLIGLWRRLRIRRRGGPFCGELFSQRRMRDWLALLGFDLVAGERFFYRPPVGSDQLMQRLSWLESIGGRFWPFFAGCYVLVARKRVTTITPIRPHWTAKRRLSAVGLVGTASNATDVASRQVGRRAVHLKVFSGGLSDDAEMRGEAGRGLNPLSRS